ncbi:MAG: ATP-binding protein [Verrucomicrobiota bacterium]
MFEVMQQFFPFLLLGVILLAAIVGVFFYTQIFLPVNRIKQLTEDIAVGDITGGFVPSGILGLDDVIRNLEAVAHRLNEVEKSAELENFNLRAILSSMVEGVMVVDTTGRIRMANYALEEMFDLKHDGIGRTVMEVLRNAEVQEAIERTVFRDEGHQQEINLLQLKDEMHTGQSFEMNCAPLHDATGKLSGVVVVFHDITRIKQLEDIRQEFVANVSHELRTPLSIFRGYLETLMETPNLTKKECNRVLHALNRHSNRLNALVNDLLTLTRLESGNTVLAKVTLNLPEFFKRLQEDWQKPFNKKSCSLDLELDENLKSLDADALKLEQVVYNLLENALKYSNEGDRVVLGTRFMRDDKEMHCYVKDNGIGIPREKVSQIFERFYRIDKARSREMGGTGLGLSIVKHIIQLHDGRVWAESEVNKGTTIWFSLPLENKF